MDPEARHRMVMRVIDHYALASAEAAAEDARATSPTDPKRRAGHQAAARHGAAKAASIRIEVDQMIRGLLGLPQA